MFMLVKSSILVYEPMAADFASPSTLYNTVVLFFINDEPDC